ncbi:Cyclic di-AMP synthase CdaA [bacterium HR29]|jgi:diadenylate cyclase|nr:Cyclic di-AMP synthase CdaA [bacterium HR29]
MFDWQHYREVIDQFGPSSVIDVLLIAALIYGALRVMSGTRAMTQLRGAVILFLVAVLLGRAFDLTVVNYIVENSLPALLIAVVIIFQPEIRRALDRLGRTGLRGLLSRPDASEVLDAISRAAGELSRARHGALMVIERGTGLRDVIDTGVPIDARVTPELLEGIFFPNSPLHDMAVVIRDDRVVAAGCVLPLADQLPPEESHLGTRHRAALGITEHTDAVSIVVSEETGGISVAVDGRLTHVADEQRLRTVLEWLVQRRGALRREREREPVP